MARVNYEKVEQVVELLRKHPPETKGVNFIGTMFPVLDHPQALPFFFFGCLHQYGFWYGDQNGYVQPMIGTVKGKELKGSDLLWTLLKRQLDRDPMSFNPDRLVRILPQDLGVMLADDAGTQWPDFEQRLSLSRVYGSWLTRMGWTPESIVAWARRQSCSLWMFRQTMKGTGSPFADDRFEKKQVLLGMILVNRPEHFLYAGTHKSWIPIVDYHLMRLCLRLGLVYLVEGEESRSDIAGRRWVSKAVEREIRWCTSTAVEQIVARTGFSMATVDEILWKARDWCPEMTHPNCGLCSYYSVCARRVELFQPVFRTTAY